MDLFFIVIVSMLFSSQGFSVQNLERINKPFLDISKLTTLEVEDYVKNKLSEIGIAPIIIPIGSTEQHGPTGLIGTDWLNPSAIAKSVCEECAVLFGPQIQIGMSLHHCNFPGSVSLRPSTLVSVICDVVSSLRQSSNFTHFFFVNGHGGNILPIKFAFEILKTQQKHVKEPGIIVQTDKTALPFQLELISWYDNTDTASLARSLYGKELGQHATPDEVAMTMFLFPDLPQKEGVLDPNVILKTPPGKTALKVEENGVAILECLLTGVTDEEERNRLLEFGRIALSYKDPKDFRRRFSDGRMWSNPGLATKEHGELIFATSTKSAMESFKKFSQKR